MFNNWLLPPPTNTCFVVFACSVNTPIMAIFKLPTGLAELKTGRQVHACSAEALPHTTATIILLDLQIRKLLNDFPKQAYLARRVYEMQIQLLL